MQVDFELPLALGQGVVGRVQFGLQLLLAALEQRRGDGLLVEAHIEQGVLTGFQALDQAALGGLHLGDGILADGRHGTDRRPALLHVAGAQLDRLLDVVALDGSLDQLGGHVGPLGAGRVVDSPSTEEVGVELAVAAPAEGIDQAAAALAAKDAAPEVVLAILRPLGGQALLVQQGLHGVEGVLADQRFMTALERLLVLGTALVDDGAAVVRIAQHALDGAGGERAGRTLGGRAGADAESVQLADKLRDRVLAAGVQLEGQHDIGAAVRVDSHDGDAAAIRQDVHAVEVAEGGAVVGAADAGLLAHPALDVLARLHRLELILGGDHALVEEGGGAVLADHRLGNGDELGPGLAHQLAGLPVVALVACPAAERPHDHVVHAG